MKEPISDTPQASYYSTVTNILVMGKNYLPLADKNLRLRDNFEISGVRRVTKVKLDRLYGSVNNKEGDVNW